LGGRPKAKVGVGLLRECLEKRGWYVMADDRGRLEQTLLLDGQAVDARGQNRVDAGWNLDGVDGLGEAIRAELADERFRLHEGAYALLEEERVPFRLSINGCLSPVPESIQWRSSNTTADVPRVPVAFTPRLSVKRTAPMPP
jgi:hypothetical protein